MKKIKILLFTSILIMFISCGKNDTPSDEISDNNITPNKDNTIRVRVTNYPPQYYKENNQWKGIDIELAEALVKEAGFKVEFVKLPWSRGLTEIRNGNIDLMLNLSITEERKEFLTFIGPQKEMKMVLVVHKNNKDLKVTDIDELIVESKLNNRKIAIQQDVFYSEEFNQRLKDDLDFASNFESVTQGKAFHQMLNSKRILGFFENNHLAEYQIKTNDEFKNFSTINFYISTDLVYFGISKKIPPEKLKRLTEANTRLQKSNILNEIINKWEKE